MRYILSLLSMITCCIYFGVGIFGYHRNQRAKINQIFLWMAIALGSWSLTSAIVYLDAESFPSRLMESITAIGNAFFVCLLLIFVLAMGRHPFLRNKWAKSVLFLPVLAHVVMTLLYYHTTVNALPIIHHVYQDVTIVFCFVYAGLSLHQLIGWEIRNRNQSRDKIPLLFFVVVLFPLVTHVVIRWVLPQFHPSTLIHGGHLYYFFPFLGLSLVIQKSFEWQIPYSQVNRMLLASMLDVTMLLDGEGRIVDVSERFEKILGYEKKEVQQYRVNELFPELEMGESFAQVRKESKPVLLAQTSLKAKDGEDIPFNIMVSAMWATLEKRVVGYLVVAQDIRLIQNLQQEVEIRKQTQLQWQQSEELFRIMVQMLPYAIFMTRIEDDIVLYVNPRAASLFGMKKEEMIGSHAYTYYADPASRDALKQEFLASDSLIYEREILLRRKDGSDFIGQINVQKARFRQDEVLLFAIGDVSEQRSLQMAVTQSEELLRKLMESIPDYVVVTDMSGNITYVNLAVREMFASIYAMPKTFLDLGWEDSSLVQTHLCKHEDEEFQFEARHRNIDGEIQELEVHANILQEDGSSPFGIIYVMRDVTQRRLMEFHLLQSKEEIETINNKLMETNSILSQQMIRDSLTNLYNMQHINAVLAKEMEQRANPQYQTPLSVMMLDIDFFKRVNDTYGHLYGDVILQDVAKSIQQCLRGSDYAGRFGGEEFIVVLPEVGLELAVKIAQRIRNKIKDTKYERMDGITISIGVATWDASMVDVHSLVKRADALLYQAKRNGRNRVEFE